MSKESVTTLIQHQTPELRQIGEKVINGIRLSDEDGLLLFEQGSLSYVGALANYVREKLHDDKTY